MDLWHAFGVTRETGLVAAAGCFIAALLFAGGLVLRRQRDDRRPGLGLDDR